MHSEIQRILLFQLRVQLLKHFPTLIVLLQRKQEKAAPTAALLPLIAHLLLLSRVIVGRIGVTLVLNCQHSAIDQLSDEIRIEVIG